MILVNYFNKKDGEQRYNNYNELYISECCWYCGKELVRIKDILVDKDDHYLCCDCKNEFNIDAIPCKEMD
jgi:hypothetical protein